MTDEGFEALLRLLKHHVEEKNRNMRRSIGGEKEYCKFTICFSNGAKL
jgi:hypothetical protein